MNEINEERLQELLRSKLGAYWDRALSVFRDYGKNLSQDVINILLKAVEAGMADHGLRYSSKTTTISTLDPAHGNPWEDFSMGLKLIRLK